MEENSNRVSMNERMIARKGDAFELAKVFNFYSVGIRKEFCAKKQLMLGARCSCAIVIGLLLSCHYLFREDLFYTRCLLSRSKIYIW